MQWDTKNTLFHNSIWEKLLRFLKFLILTSVFFFNIYYFQIFDVRNSINYYKSASK